MRDIERVSDIGPDQPATAAADDRRAVAVARARTACEMLAARGVAAQVIGSLASGRFGPASDIDLLVTACPHDLKYAIEGAVEDCLGGFRFDVIYLDEIPPHKVERVTRDAVDARDLR